jgi:two-component system, chemotaxis family, protein-glutamate methylesterase/glutaminase
VAETFQGSILGVIMTGMGSDGLKGMTTIKQKGGVTVAQDEESCVVYGMPRVCVESGIVDHVLPLSQLARSIVQLTGHEMPK